MYAKPVVSHTTLICGSRCQDGMPDGHNELWWPLTVNSFSNFSNVMASVYNELWRPLVLNSFSDVMASATMN